MKKKLFYTDEISYIGLIRGSEVLQLQNKKYKINK